MRRRIDLNPEGDDLRDVTGDAHLLSDPWEYGSMALHDAEDVWAAYLAAEGAYRDAVRAVIERLRPTPLDDVERAAAEAAEVLMQGDHFTEGLDALRERLLAHAATA